MTTIQVTLSEALREFVEEQVAQGGYASADEYIGALVRDAQKHAARARIEALLIEGLDSGPPIEVNEQFWEERRRRLEARFPDESRS